MSSVYIVAEIGCNHNGDYNLAKLMIDEAYSAGVNAVKFQTFKADSLISKYAPKAEYQIKTTGNSESQLEMTRKLELSCEEYIKLEEYSKSLGLDVFSTPFDLESIEFLYTRKQTTWKIPSGELLNLPYLEKIALLPGDKKIILSTGMATLAEIKQALKIFTDNGVKAEDITILHCNTEYPTPYEDVNLNVLAGLKKIFQEYNIGFSDHSPGYFAGI
ncbi:TPA: N-acetylneuraminate synthase family protein, partial [Escherichia coli]